MYKLTKQDVQIHLDNLKRSNPKLSDLVLHNADARCGKRIALAKVGENGTLDVKTDFLTYTEMNQFLRGYSFKSENRLKK